MNFVREACIHIHMHMHIHTCKCVVTRSYWRGCFDVLEVEAGGGATAFYPFENRMSMCVCQLRLYN